MPPFSTLGHHRLPQPSDVVFWIPTNLVHEPTRHRLGSVVPLLPLANRTRRDAEKLCEHPFTRPQQFPGFLDEVRRVHLRLQIEFHLVAIELRPQLVTR